MTRETLINVIDLNDGSLTEFVINILQDFNSWGYDYSPDRGYSIFTRTDFIVDVLKEQCEIEGISYSDVELALPHSWTVICLGGDVFP